MLNLKQNINHKYNILQIYHGINIFSVRSWKRLETPRQSITITLRVLESLYNFTFLKMETLLEETSRITCLVR